MLSLQNSKQAVM